MQDKLNAIEQRLESINAQLNAPETYSSPDLIAQLSKEKRELQPIADAYHRKRTLESDLQAAQDLGFSSADISEIKEELASAEHDLRMTLLPKDPYDEKSVIVEIRAGTGGEEAALFAADLFRMYNMYADRKGWRIEIASMNATELGGYKEIVFTVEGDGAFSRFKYEAGSHCVKRVPETESSGRIQTSTATVAVLPEMDEDDFALDMKDVKIDVFRSSGAGGQKVNKTSSAIRVTHIPSGTVVECQDERSQYKNKDRALSILRSRLYEADREKKEAGVAAARKIQVGTGERSEKIRTYFFLRGQVVDQRLAGDDRTFNLDSVLNGNLDEMLERLITADQAEKLRTESL